MLLKERYWQNPKSHSVGQFTDLRLYYDALFIGAKQGFLSKEILEKLLPERIIGLKFISAFKNRTISDLIRELLLFKFLKKKTINDFELSDLGKQLLELYKENPEKYYEILIQKMQEIYSIPGWFVHRLWQLNPQGQGQIVLPSPIKEWKSKGQDWNDNKWSKELNDVTNQTILVINKKLPNSFPVQPSLWIEETKKEYERLGSHDIRNYRHQKIVKGKQIKTLELPPHFSPRRRLTLAMKNVSVKILFGNLNPITKEKDFYSSKDPLNARTIMVWCPRLETFGFIFYTDYHPEIPGRIIFPTSVFKKGNTQQNFKYYDFIQTPEKKILSIFNPKWESFRITFLKNINEIYQTIFDKDGVIYISLQDLRDEVCRQLRINSSLFEFFLQKAFEESIKGKIDFAISLETDIREDQKNAYQVIRKGVHLNNLQHSLIAIKKYSF